MTRPRARRNVTFTLSAEEFDRLHEAAARKGINRASFARRAVIDQITAETTMAQAKPRRPPSFVLDPHIATKPTRGD